MAHKIKILKLKKGNIMKKLIQALIISTGFISLANAASLTIVNNSGSNMSIAHHNQRGPYQQVETGKTETVEIDGLMTFANNYDLQSDLPPTNSVSTLVYGPNDDYAPFRNKVAISGYTWNKAGVPTNVTVSCSLDGKKVTTTLKTGDEGQLCDEGQAITLTMNGTGATINGTGIKPW